MSETYLFVSCHEFGGVSSLGEIFKLPKLFLLVSRVCIVHRILLVLSLSIRFLVRRRAHHALFRFRFWRPPPRFLRGFLLNDGGKACGFWVLPLPNELRRYLFLLRSEDRVLACLLWESDRWLWLFLRRLGLLLSLHEIFDVAFNRIHASRIRLGFACSLFL